MKDFVFITGNMHKLEYLQKWLGVPVIHQKIDLEELQSLDPVEVTTHKAQQAYAIIGKPVLVEDVSLVFLGMGRLPGTFIKWFLEEIGTEGLCRIGRSLEDTRARAGITYGLYDGTDMHIFSASVEGIISPEPRSLEGNDWKTSLSWNSVFIPDGSTKTYAEMTDEELKPFSHRAKAVADLKSFLTKG